MPASQRSIRAATLSLDWAVACDFDGTIANTDVTDGVLSRFALPEWETIETEWQSGRIGSRECMAQQIALVRATREELNSYLDTVEIDPSFIDFVNDCKTYGLHLRVVSDGIDYGIKRILSRYNLSHLSIAANRLVEYQPGRYRLEFPHSAPNCRSSSGTCKCALSDRDLPRKTLLIGDGRSDFCLAQNADYVFAKDGLLDYCRKNGIAHCDFKDFADVRIQIAHLSECFKSECV